MNAEILAVGTELLLGEIVNTNAQFLSQKLAELGIGVYYQTVVGDNRERLLKAFEDAFNRAELVITTGGLGPTDDDLTKEVAAEFFGKQLVLHEESLQQMQAYFKKQGFDWTENNKKQALMPEGSTPLKNDAGTAPGCLMNENGKVLILLPGPPLEMKPMFENYAMPHLQGKSDVVFYSKRVKICGVGESKAATIVSDLLENQTNPTIAPYAGSSEVALRVTACAKSEAEAEEIMRPTIEEIKKRLGDNVYGVGDITLEQAVMNALLEKGKKIAVAESCTGGLLAARLVNCSGISDVLVEGVVAYSNEAKVKRLGVSEDTLKKHGAVSKEVAVEMAEGICKASGASVGVSTTGVAGPTGGTEEKPVGLVYIAVCVDGKTKAWKMNFLGDRERIRNRTVVMALDYIRRELL